MEKFAQALRSDLEDTLTCNECEERLPEYVNAQLLTGELSPEYSEVERHLQLCPHCASIYAVFSDQVREGYLATVSQDLSFEPDLSFLPAENIQLDKLKFQFGSLQALKNLITFQFSQPLIDALNQPNVSPIGVKSASTAEIDESLIYEDDSSKISFTAERDEHNPQPYQLTFKIGVKGKKWPELSGTEISVRDRDHVEFIRKETDGFGVVVVELSTIHEITECFFTISMGKDTVH
ncbi:MAG: zf-HC2 domain-containing protein [Chloroflexota bacterium]